MEECVPIEVKTVHHFQQIYEDSKFYNILVRNCPPYIKKNTGHYVRAQNIIRYVKEDNIDWPIHPKDDKDHIRGAIILIQSTDSKFLLIKNNGLWGCPKGARHYIEFNNLKTLVLDALYSNLPVPTFENIRFQEEESPVENVTRETLEETSIVLDPERLVQLVDHTHSYNRFTYTLDVDSTSYEPNNFVIDHENDELKWFSQDEIKMMLSKHVKDNYIFNYVSYLFLRDRFQQRQQNSE